MKLPHYGPIEPEMLKRLEEKVIAPLRLVPEPKRKIIYRAVLAVAKAFAELCEIERREKLAAMSTERVSK